MLLLKQRFVPFLVSLVLVSAGCAALRFGEQPFRFSHADHQKVKNCQACHPSDGDEIGMPELKTCMICHKNIDPKKPPERQIETLFVDGVYQATSVTALSDEVIFSHKGHAEDLAIGCDECHKGVMQSRSFTKADQIGMGECVACHERTGSTPATAGGIDDCALCHTEISADTEPKSHAQNWKRFHGQKALDGDQHGMNQCDLCHTEESCNSCHRTEAPANHTNVWRERGHGIAVSMDRDECSTCHQSDFCASCHNTTAPRTHRGQWGGRKNQHCLHCHIPVSGENCTVCHQQGTPSHALASPNPHDSASLDCRSCHGAGAPMPHVDNGDNCSFCHK